VGVERTSEKDLILYGKLHAKVFLQITGETSNLLWGSPSFIQAAILLM